MEFALLYFYKQLVLQEVLENLLDMEHMFLGGTREDKDVISVDKYEPVQHVMENIIDMRLEHSRGIDKAKWHDQILIVTAGPVERRSSTRPNPIPAPGGRHSVDGKTRWPPGAARRPRR
jgi:hypothetical protein